MPVKLLGRSVVFLALPLVLLGVGSVAALARSPQSKCLIINLRTHRNYPVPQEAVDDATAGDTLKVKGTCYGDTIVSKDLAIVGESNPGFGGATITGGDQLQTQAVVIIRGATVTITGITITGGYNHGVKTENAPVTREMGGGIDNEGGSLTLNNSTVSGNRVVGERNPNPSGSGGGGIYTEGGSLTLNNSVVSGNTGFTGGAIDNEGGTVTLNNSTVSENIAAPTGHSIGAGPREGGGIDNFGSLTLNDSAVIHNSVNLGRGGFLSEGGGIENHAGSSLSLNDSTISDNIAASGGGISNDQGTITLVHSTVNGNSAEGNEIRGDGGGIQNVGSAIVDDSTVSTNSAIDGGGVSNARSLTLNGSSSVINNTSSDHGGGIYNLESSGATVTFGTGWSGAVSGNEPDNIFNA